MSVGRAEQEQVFEFQVVLQGQVWTVGHSHLQEARL